MNFERSWLCTAVHALTSARLCVEVQRSQNTPCLGTYQHAHPVPLLLLLLLLLLQATEYHLGQLKAR
jgi:hypothetical protein